MRLVLALGGNALLRRGEPPEIDVQRGRVREAIRALAGLASRHELLLTHGNGPQVGLLALQAEGQGTASPLDVLVAESEGMIGYLFEQELRRALPGREVATLLTQVEVAPDDPAFDRPAKRIGRVYPRAEGERLARERRWRMAVDGDGLRRVVPSPRPRRVLGLRAIRILLDAGCIVVCGGGGGIPVVDCGRAGRRGVEVVVDKDHTAALLAEGVDAEGLVLLTDTMGVWDDLAGAEPQLIRNATPDQLRAREFEEGSMGPKVAAACDFVERTRGWAAIGRLEEAADVVAGAAGTRIEVLAPVGAAGRRSSR